MFSRIRAKMSLHRLDERLVLGGCQPSINFKVSTDVAFGGKSKASFDENRYFRGELVGDLPFAAIRAVLPEEVQDIGDFSGLSIRVKSKDKRNFAINLQTPSYFPHDLYQGFIVLPRSNEFFELSIPFSHLLLTGKGRVREVQRLLDTYTVNTLGFSVGGPGATPGPFEFEIDWVKWVK
jgi:hypothetical protein